jgi:hypothetical protein
MGEVYLLRHGEKNTDGTLTERGKRAAEAMRSILPHFVTVISSSSDRAILTAQLLTGEDPRIDQRAGYATTSPEISSAINGLAISRAISFLDATRLYNDQEVLQGIDEQARELNMLTDELLAALSEDEKALIVSHDLTITPAMGFRDMPAESIEPLGGYIISENNGIQTVCYYR